MLSVICVSLIPAQAIRDKAGASQPLPVTKISIFSSGLAYYEHSGTLNGPAVIDLAFKANEVNDVLKSLVLNDPASANPAVTYQSEQTLIQTLRSLKIDLSEEPVLADILRGLRGAELEIAVPATVSGRIVGVEYRYRASPVGNEVRDPWLSLYTDQGIRLFNFADINAITFKDPQIAEDLARALDLLASSRNYNTRDLMVNLPGSGSRKVSLSYVIPSPVWKVSYRLDLGREQNAKPLLQGWAIVDNDGDSDWSNVELSLVAGRPASFIQNLYPPYYVYRPVQPLAIAGAAAAATHDAAYDTAGSAPMPSPSPMAARATAAKEMRAEAEAAEADRAYYSLNYNSVAGGTVETATGTAAGDQFEFTVKTPVSLNRRMSAMLPLVESQIEARKLLIFSGASAGRNRNPRLGAELTNTSKMKLPAGPITVYDGGTYAGDALIEFWNEGEKRLISFGEDLSVTGAVTDSLSRNIASVTVSGGVMVFNNRQEDTKTYTFKNNSSQEKALVIEHPKNQGTTLETPKADEETPSLYRFNTTLPAGKELAVPVREVRPITERITLLSLRPDAFLTYVTNQEIPQRVRDALQRAVSLRDVVTSAQAAVNEAESRRNSFVSEQDRIRKNLEAAGGQTQQGQEYLKRLMALDASIDSVNAELETLRTNQRTAQKAYEDYLRELNL